MPLTQEQLEANRKRLLAQKQTGKVKTEAQVKGEQMYQEAQQSGQVFNQANGGTGQAVATDTGLKLIEGTESKMKPGDTRMAPGYISDSEIPTSSYEEIGKAQQEADYQTTREAMDALGLGDSPSDYEQYLKAQVESKKMKDESERLALEAQRKDLQTAAGSITAQSDAQQAMAASAIGGPQANTGLRQGWQQAASKQLERLKLDEKQLAIYDEQLKNAQLAGDMELVQQIQLQKDAYTNQAMQNEAQYVQALGDYERNKAAITQAGIASFQSLVESGVELDYNTVAGLASQYGLPTDTLMGYYQGAQNIRNDKTLDLAGKELALAQLNQDLNDQMNGLTTEAAKKIDYMNKQTQQWVEMGYTNEEVTQLRSNMRTMLGIEDQSDPAYQAEIAYKNAQTAYSQSNTAVNYQDMLAKEYAYNSSMGYVGGAYVPNSTRGGLYQVSTTTSEDGSTSIEILNKDGEPIKVGDYGGQCGKFVNDLFGADVFTDLIGEKLAKVDPSITMPAPGMAMVWRTQGESAPYGHVVYVTGVDAENQVVNYVDSNGDGAGEKIGTGTITFQELGNLISSGDGGLVVNPNSTQQGGASKSTLQAQALGLLKGYGGTSDERSAIVNEMMMLMETGEASSLSEAKKTLGVVTTTDENFMKRSQEELKPAKDVFSETTSRLASLPDLLTSETGAADVAGLVYFLKQIDPDSVAREAEVDAVRNAVGVLDLAGQQLAKLKDGELLGKDQRQAILDAVKTIQTASSKKLYSDMVSYGKEYDDMGLDIVNLYTDTFFKNVSKQLSEEDLQAIDSEYVDLASEEDPNVQLQTEYESYSTYNDPDFLEAQGIYEGGAGSFASVLNDKTTRQRRY